MLNPHQIPEVPEGKKIAKANRDVIYNSSVRQRAVRAKRSTLGAHNNLIPKTCTHLMQTMNPQDLEILYKIQLDKEKRAQNQLQE